MDYKKTNREKSQESDKSKWYCYCDLSMVGDIGKCSVCGRDFKTWNKGKKKKND